MERIDLRKHRHAVRQRWRDGDEWDRSTTTITVGELRDGRWYASWCDWNSSQQPGCAYAGSAAEHYARMTAKRWRRTFGGTWIEMGRSATSR